MKNKGNFQNERQWHGHCKVLDYPYFKRWKPLQKETMMKCLLIVDDDPDHRLILRTMFEGEGYECEEASDGEGALRTLNTNQMALVLTDLNMPGMNGLQLIDQMQTLACTRNTPVILLTSQLTEDIPVKAYTNGARAILSKPYDFSKLLAEVRGAIVQPESSALPTTA